STRLPTGVTLAVREAWRRERTARDRVSRPLHRGPIGERWPAMASEGGGVHLPARHAPQADREGTRPGAARFRGGGGNLRPRDRQEVDRRAVGWTDEYS